MKEVWSDGDRSSLSVYCENGEIIFEIASYDEGYSGYDYQESFYTMSLPQFRDMIKSVYNYFLERQ